MVKRGQKELINMRDNAIERKIPIMEDDGLAYLIKFIHDNNIKRVLEIGTAIGYSSIMMAITNKKLEIVTVEKDQDRYFEAIKNVKKFKLEDRITLIYKDAVDLKLDDKFDLVFLDAAKGQNKVFFENFKKNVSDEGFIITDNMNFHGYVDKDLEDIESKNIRGIVKKLIEYKKFLINNSEFDSKFKEVGDGLAISQKV